MEKPPVLESTSQLNGATSPLGNKDSNVFSASSDTTTIPLEPPPQDNETGQDNADGQPQQTVRKEVPKVPSRPAQLIRNLHASYFNRDPPGPSPPRPEESAVARAVHSFRSRVFAFGTVVSVAGCAILLGQGRAGHGRHNFGHLGLVTQVAYHGIFAAMCSWQWFKRMGLENNESIDSTNGGSGTNFDGDRSVDDTEAESIHVLDPCNTAADKDELQNSSATSPLTRTTSTSLTVSYCILGYGLLGFFGFTSTLAAQTWSSYFWNPILVLASLSPLVMGSILLGLDKISIAFSKDEIRHENELCELQDRYETQMEAYRDDNLYKKNLLLETVGKEVQDAATLAIETLRQMTPVSLFTPSISREQLSPCTLPIPITSILGLFTTMRHLQYISRNMQRLSRVMFTEYVQGIVERTSPHYHRSDRGESKFDVGEFVQSLGDLVSADASLKGVELVIYHSEYELNHVLIKGSEESWRHALINLIKSIIDCAKAGSTIELCLVLFTITQERNRVMVSFEITYYPSPDSNEDDLSQLNSILASKLVKAMGGSLEIEQLDKRVKRFVISVEVELSHVSQEEKIGGLRHLDDQHQPIHPFEPSTDVAQPVATPDHLQRLENMQTAHPVHESQQFFQQHIRTPLVSPSPPPTSPPPRRTGSSSSPKVSAEPTVSELIRFSRKLAGLKVVLMAKEHSAFAVRLDGYLNVWGVIVLKKTISENTGASGESESGDIYVSDDPPTPSSGAKRTNSSSSLSGKHSGHSGKSEPVSSTSKSLNPAFIMIDDDVKALGQQILKMQSSPTSPAPAGVPKRMTTHRRQKSVTSIQHTSIIYFTSLPTFKQARDTIMSILGTQMPGMNFNITNSLTGNVLGQGPLGPLPNILVLPKPAGPRRVLTAIHTAINVPVLEHSYSPIATAPTSPAPTIRHFSEEINPLDRDQIVIDPVSNQAFARTVPLASQNSPGGLSPNSSVPHNQRQKRDLMRQLIDAGGSPSTAVYPFDQSTADILSSETPGSIPSVGSPTGIVIPGIAGQPAGIQFDPTARLSGTLSPALTGPHRRVSNGSARSVSSNESGTVVIPPTNGAQNHQSFALMHAQRASESTTPSTNFIRLNNGQLLRPGTGRSPLGSPLTITQSNGVLFSPPGARHPGMASPLPQRPEPAATRNSNNGSGGSMDSPKISHPVLPHGSIPSSSPLSTSPGALIRTGSGTPVMGHGHAASPPPHDAVPGRGRGSNPVKKVKDPKAPVKSDVVERVSPLVNVLIVEDNYINQTILVKFMRQRKIKYDIACNGREAVDKWKVGGFHLVLMDIQMPVMDGIEATREIRRLEKAQKIGVFPTHKLQNAIVPAATSLISSSSSTASPSTPPASPFRSPVIIVALTASAESENLRRTALLAGCNDYITKPVEFPWLERKIVDWGCMQALIDVDAWKEWKKDLEGTSPGSPSAGASGRSGGSGNNNIATTMSPKKLLSGSGSISKALMKRPSLSARSIKGAKTTAAAAVSKNVETSGDTDKKHVVGADGESSDNKSTSAMVASGTSSSSSSL